MKTFLLSLVFFVVAAVVRPAFAIYDPLSVPNNPYGMHIVEYNDVPELSDLVNTTGGDWGYVTFVISDRDHDVGKIQKLFDEMRRKHLIPLVRIATHPEGPLWVKPQDDTFDSIVSFLMKLHWPIENRYVILYNEPNHANEWGGTIDPEGYAKTVVSLGKKLKEASTDFFILPAGLDVSAASDGRSLNAAEYLKRMVVAEPELLHTIDGWTSHSYPNPAFSGSPYATGRGSLRSFEWELQYLESLGFSKKLPVFITETGWIHAEGIATHYGAYSSDALGKHIIAASEGAWKDPRIVAITPFVYNYQGAPFDGFSWKVLGNSGLYPFAESYKQIPKRDGNPQQRESYEIDHPLIPETLIANSSYHLTAQIQNLGQGIIDEADGYSLDIQQDGEDVGFLFDPMPIVEPFKKGELSVHIRTPKKVGTYNIQLRLRHHSKDTILQSVDLSVLPPPSITIQAQLGWRQTQSADDVTVLLYDERDLLNKFSGLSIEDGIVDVSHVAGVIPGKKYRVVLLVPSYLPRQSIVTLEARSNTVKMKRLYPFDINRDGALTFADLEALLYEKPMTLFDLFFGA
jgi:hypothetical protein